MSKTKGNMMLIAGTVIGLSAGAVGTYFAVQQSAQAVVKTPKVQLKDVFTAPRPVALARVVAVDYSRKTRYPGQLEAYEKAQLAFRVGGPLTGIYVEPGSRVKKGDKLMQIDPRDYEDRMAALEAHMQGAKAGLDQAKQDFERAKNLFSQSVIPQADFDRASTQLLTAEAGVKELEAQLGIARHNLDDTTLEAPFYGIVTGKKINNFEMVRAGQVVLTMHSIQRQKITIYIPESVMLKASLTTDEHASVVMPGNAGVVCDAVLEEWSTAADPATLTYALTFAFDAPEDVTMLPGMTAEVLWRPRAGEEDAGALLVPVNSVEMDINGGSFVWVYDALDEKVHEQPVKLGSIVGSSYMQVFEGLKKNDLVVTAGSDFVTEGMLVSAEVPARN